MKGISLCSLLLVFCFAAQSTVWQVGSSRTYKKPSAVMPLVGNGDTVIIDAETYVGDVGTWTKHNLHIISRGAAYAHLKANGAHAGGKAIWVVQGDNTYIEGIEFSEASVPDKNGAGIRQEGVNLHLHNCYFHDNENGILAGDKTGSTIRIEFCRFHDNGYGDGLTHNMYINKIDAFILKYTHSHHAYIGHCVKTRARKNIIAYNLLADEASGEASMLLDIPNGGHAEVYGNAFMQGPNATNKRLVTFGTEGFSNPQKKLWFYNNTMINERHTGTFVFVASGADSVLIMNNIMLGVGDSVLGPANWVSNYRDAASVSLPIFCAAASYDYSLCGSDSRIVDQGSNPSTWGKPDPMGSFASPNDSIERIAFGLYDLGAYEYASSAIKEASIEVKLAPNPVDQEICVLMVGVPFLGHLIITNLDGKIMYEGVINDSESRIDIQNWSPGLYIVQLQDSNGLKISQKFFIAN